MENQVPIMTPDRAMYEWLTKQSKYAGLKITQGYLRLLILLGSTGSFKFNIMNDAGSAPIAGENRLERSDAFCATQHGFFIGKAASGQNPRSVVEQSFANPFIFTDATENEALNTLYNGQLKIQISDRLYFQKLDLKRFKNVGTAQQGLNMTQPGVGINDQYPASEWNPKTGLYELTPHIEFSGQSTPEVEVTLPASVNMAGTASTNNYAILYYRGFYIPDGAKLGGGK